MPPAAPVPTTAPPMSRTTRLSNPPPPGEGGTFRTVKVICDVPDTAPRVAVIVIVYVVSTDTVGAQTVTCWWPVAPRENVDRASVIAGDAARITFAPAAGSPVSPDTATSIAPGPPYFTTLPNGVSASNLRTSAP